LKIAITGHTRGLGAELVKRFEEGGHSVIGFSRSNGYDISKADHRANIIEQASQCDMFINNAYWGFAQVALLNDMFAAWSKRSNKYIINVSSDSSYHQKYRHHPYAVHKIALDEQTRQLQPLGRWPTITNVRPGTFESDMGNRIEGKKMSVHTAADVIMYVFQNRDRFTVRDIVYESV
jgi:NAD(P)-dependent dehydrogenase (short-subunit alcohol dehydrogenase family)